MQQPVIGVTIPYPGASPSEVERDIVRPVEEAVFGISGLDADKSTCFAIDGLAQCTIFFDFEKPIQQASQDIRDAISVKRADLPPEMKEPVLTRFDPSEQPAMTLTLTSDRTPAEILTRIADPSITGVAALDPRRGAGERGRRDQAQHGDRGAADGRAGGGAQRRAGPAARAAAEPRRAGGLDQRRAERAADPPERPARRASRISRTSWSPTGTGRSSGSARWRTSTTARRSRARRALFNGREAVGIEIMKSKGYSTTAVSERDPRARRGDPEDAARRA